MGAGAGGEAGTGGDAAGARAHARAPRGNAGWPKRGAARQLDNILCGVLKGISATVCAASGEERARGKEGKPSGRTSETGAAGGGEEGDGAEWLGNSRGWDARRGGAGEGSDSVSAGPKPVPT